MKTKNDTKAIGGMTLIEVLTVIAVLMIFAAFFLPDILRSKQMVRSPRIQCVNNLKQIALATRVWESDNNDKFPAAVSVTNGGAMEFMSGPNAWKNYQVMSNELSTPKVVTCPAETDAQRFCATNFTWFNNSNLSFFVGIVSNEANPQLFLSGDHNLTNALPVKNGWVELTPGRPSGWTAEMHNQVGNIAFADGSVQQLSSRGLQVAATNSGIATNLILMPILGP